MKKQHKFILGIDISKNTFDIALGKNEPESEVTKSNFTNNLKGFQKLDSWFEKLGISYSDCLFCMENTGIYHRLLAGYLKSKKALSGWNPVFKLSGLWASKEGRVILKMQSES